MLVSLGLPEASCRGRIGFRALALVFPCRRSIKSLTASARESATLEECVGCHKQRSAAPYSRLHTTVYDG